MSFARFDDISNSEGQSGRFSGDPRSDPNSDPERDPRTIRLGFLERLGRRARNDPADPKNDLVPFDLFEANSLPSSNRANQNLKVRFEVLQSNLNLPSPFTISEQEPSTSACNRTLVLKLNPLRS